MIKNYETTKNKGKSKEQLDANKRMLKEIYTILKNNIEDIKNDICKKMEDIISEYAKELLKIIKDQWKPVLDIQGLTSPEEISSFYEYINYKLQLQGFLSESDLLVVLPVSKTVLIVEVKAGSKRGVLKKSAQQTKKRVKFFTKVFVPRNWSVIKASCCPKLDQVAVDGICDYCNQFFITYRYVSFSLLYVVILSLKKSIFTVSCNSFEVILILPFVYLVLFMIRIDLVK